LEAERDRGPPDQAIPHYLSTRWRLPMLNKRNRIEQTLREDFEKGLHEEINDRIDSTRDAREEELADTLEEQMRDEFEKSLPDDIETELEDTRQKREEELAEELETQMREEFEDKLGDAIEAALEEESESA
jgi:hypothetical protein